MKKLIICTLTALGVAVSGFSSQAQRNPNQYRVDTLRSTDSQMQTNPPQSARKIRQRGRKNRNTTYLPDTGNYRAAAVGTGTALNNSNTTSYDSQAAIAPASGVNAVPTTMEPISQPARSGKKRESVSGNSAVSLAPTPGNGPDPDREGDNPHRSKTLSVGDFIAASPNYTTLQNALQTTKLDQTLKGAGRFTVFAPTNEAFKKLPAQTQRVLLEGNNAKALQQLLTYHIVMGEIDAAELMHRIKASNGQAQLKTIAGNTLTARLDANGTLILTDEEGNQATVKAPDFYQTNGVVHGLNSVLLPKGGTTLFH